MAHLGAVNEVFWLSSRHRARMSDKTCWSTLASLTRCGAHAVSRSFDMHGIRFVALALSCKLESCVFVAP
eukprot:4260708-Amphidinium_carterae.1